MEIVILLKNLPLSFIDGLSMSGKWLQFQAFSVRPELVEL